MYHSMRLLVLLQHYRGHTNSARTYSSHTTFATWKGAARRGAPWGGAPAEGPGGEGGGIDWGRDTPKRLYKAPTD